MILTKILTLTNHKRIIIIIEIIGRVSSTAKILGEGTNLAKMDPHFHVSRSWTVTSPTEKSSEKYSLWEGQGQPSWRDQGLPSIITKIHEYRYLPSSLQHCISSPFFSGGMGLRGGCRPKATYSQRHPSSGDQEAANSFPGNISIKQTSVTLRRSVCHNSLKNSV